MARARRIPLLARDGTVRAYTLVDAGDFEQLSRWPWRLHPGGYAVRAGGTVLMHREILGLTDPSIEGDHISGDRLDNRRLNLRPVPRRAQQQNMTRLRPGTSRFRGVSWDEQTGRWRATACVARRKYHIGRFDLEGDAAAAVAAFRRENMPYSAEALEALAEAA